MKTDSGLLTRRGFCAASAALAAIGFNRQASAAEADNDEMITQIAKFRLNPEKEAEGIQALEELCQAVEENEPGVLAYMCHRSAKKPDEVVFFEVYKDAEAMKAHGTTPHLGKIRKLFGTVFLPPLDLTRLDRVGGFAR